MNKNAVLLTGSFLAASSLTLTTISTVSSFVRKNVLAGVLLTVATTEAAIATAAFIAAAVSRKRAENAEAAPDEVVDTPSEKKPEKPTKAKKKPKSGKTSKRLLHDADFFWNFFGGEKVATDSPES